MAKIRLETQEELWPVIVESKEWGEFFDLPEDVVADFRRLEKEWFDMQEKLQNLTTLKAK